MKVKDNKHVKRKKLSLLVKSKLLKKYSIDLDLK